MDQPVASTAPALGVLSYENELLSHYERMLGETKAVAPAPRGDDEAATGSSLKRLYPLVLLALCGAAFALAQVDVKEGLLTGRSVAHAPNR